MANNKKLITSIYISNALEFFDYTLFAAFTPIINKTFFGPYSSSLSGVLVLFAFCLSLLVRPLGGYVFGYIGDKINRLTSLRLSVLMMAGASYSIAFLPSYESIGAISLVFVFLSRILQGISAGGEYNAAAIVSIESNYSKRWLMSGFLTSSAFMGLVLASGFALIPTFIHVPEWFWRLGFAIGGTLGLLSFGLRKLSIAKPQITKTQTNPVLPTKSLVPIFLMIFFIGGQTSSVGYCVMVSIKGIIGSPNLYPEQANLIIFGVFLITSVACALMGYFHQIINPLKSFWICQCLFILLSPLLLKILCIKPYTIFSCVGISFLMAWHGSLQHAIFQHVAPSFIRQRLISIAFSLGTGVLSTLIILLFKNFEKTPLAIFSFSILSSCSLFFFYMVYKTQNRQLSTQPSSIEQYAA